MRKILLGCALFCACVPFVAGALTVDELRAQIEDLLRQIDALQQQLGGGQTTPQTGGMTYIPPSATPTAVPASFDCPYISRSLKIGSSGDDVARLQQFLAFDPSLYPEAQVSGYYGALTEAAIRRFQCKNKIVCDGTPAATGYGVTGPRTASLLALQCADRAGQGQASGFIRVTPISGAAPLPVAVEATVNTSRSCAAATYELDFGDQAARIPIHVPANTCNELRQTFSHTYVSGGVFTILLRSGTHQVSANVSVSGGSGQTGDTMYASPTSGARPLQATFTGVVNAAGVCDSGQYSINFGDGQTATINLSGCTPNSYSITHRYDSSGNFIARLYRGGTEVRSVGITVAGSGGSGGDTSGGYFAVSPGFGGDVYTVEAEFELEKSCARYDLDWGDGASHSSQSEGNCNGSNVTKKITHTYDESGTYTLVLKRGSNLSAEDSVGVSIEY
ncbi:peptidoglycan-binding protein [Candidatus Kaiserbacteria bacterium]|nr:peptidoglycan-binding protein [Candidatus Kaiserbacteria bacterium]